MQRPLFQRVVLLVRQSERLVDVGQSDCGAVDLSPSRSRPAGWATGELCSSGRTVPAAAGGTECHQYASQRTIKGRVSIGERLHDRTSREPAPGRLNRPRLASVVARLSPDAWNVVAVAAAVLLANLLSILGIVDVNPLGPRAGWTS